MEEISEKDLPRVLKGKGFGIIEDCGGPYGLMEIVRVANEGKGKEYKELSEFYNMKAIKSAEFDVSYSNDMLKIELEKLKKAYEG